MVFKKKVSFGKGFQINRNWKELSSKKETFVLCSPNVNKVSRIFFLMFDEFVIKGDFTESRKSSSKRRDFCIVEPKCKQGFTNFSRRLIKLSSIRILQNHEKIRQNEGTFALYSLNVNKVSRNFS